MFPAASQTAKQRRNLAHYWFLGFLRSPDFELAPQRGLRYCVDTSQQFAAPL
jgi:hypothetical protein